MADLQNLFGMIGGIAQQFQAASMTSSAAAAQAQSIQIGGEVAAQGALLSAAGFRQSAMAVGQATDFNLQIDRLNLQRQLQASSRQFQRVMGRQTIQQAGTGLSLTSKSFLMLRNEASDVFSRGMLNMKLDAENQRRSKVFESQIKQMNLENQARAAEYRAAAERVMAANRAAEASFKGEVAEFRATQSAFSKIPSLLSAAFGG